MYVHMKLCVYMYVFHIDKYDCSTVNVNIQKNYKKLTYLPINSMLGSLYNKGVITLEEKQRITANPVEIDRMMYFLDRVIIPSLILNVDMKFKGFLEVMNESGDSTLLSMVANLGK